jgi:hypothetical protein
MTELDTADVSAALPSDVDTAAELMAGTLEHWLTTARERTLARYEFSLEATRQPELRARLISNGARFRMLAAELLAGLGALDAERKGTDLVAYLDGLAFDQLAGAGARSLDLARLRASCRDVLSALVD